MAKRLVKIVKKGHGNTTKNIHKTKTVKAKSSMGIKSNKKPALVVKKPAVKSLKSNNKAVKKMTGLKNKAKLSLSESKITKPLKKKKIEKPGLKSKPSKSVKKQVKKLVNIVEFIPSRSDQNTVDEKHMNTHEEYMNPEQQNHFREILLEWKNQLLEEMERTVHHMQDEAANFPDPNDRATQEEEFSLELRTRDRGRKLIKKIEEALERLDDGEYGYCRSCGVEIGIQRLKARPTATLCIDCKTIAEIQEKQYS